MLWFIGLGISGISELSNSTLEVIKNAEIVYLDMNFLSMPQRLLHQ